MNLTGRQLRRMIREGFEDLDITSQDRFKSTLDSLYSKFNEKLQKDPEKMKRLRFASRVFSGNAYQEEMDGLNKIVRDDVSAQPEVKIASAIISSAWRKMGHVDHGAEGWLPRVSWMFVRTYFFRLTNHSDKLSRVVIGDLSMYDNLVKDQVGSDAPEDLLFVAGGWES